VQYGPRITAIILYLYVGQFLSKKRTAQALAELWPRVMGDQDHIHAGPACASRRAAVSNVD